MAMARSGQRADGGAAAAGAGQRRGRQPSRRKSTPSSFIRIRPAPPIAAPLGARRQPHGLADPRQERKHRCRRRRRCKTGRARAASAPPPAPKSGPAAAPAVPEPRSAVARTAAPYPRIAAAANAMPRSRSIPATSRRRRLPCRPGRRRSRHRPGSRRKRPSRTAATRCRCPRNAARPKRRPPSTACRRNIPSQLGGRSADDPQASTSAPRAPISAPWSGRLPAAPRRATVRQPEIGRRPVHRPEDLGCAKLDPCGGRGLIRADGGTRFHHRRGGYRN